MMQQFIGCGIAGAASGVASSSSAVSDLRMSHSNSSLLSVIDSMSAIANVFARWETRRTNWRAFILFSVMRFSASVISFSRAWQWQEIYIIICIQLNIYNYQYSHYAFQLVVWLHHFAPRQSIRYVLWIPHRWDTERNCKMCHEYECAHSMRNYRLPKMLLFAFVDGILLFFLDLPTLQKTKYSQINKYIQYITIQLFTFRSHCFSK